MHLGDASGTYATWCPERKSPRLLDAFSSSPSLFHLYSVSRSSPSRFSKTIFAIQNGLNSSRMHRSPSTVSMSEERREETRNRWINETLFISLWHESLNSSLKLPVLLDTHFPSAPTSSRTLIPAPQQQQRKYLIFFHRIWNEKTGRTAHSTRCAKLSD